MRKKLVILAVAALVALITVTPALAAGNEVNGGDPQQFAVLGTVKGINAGAITIQVVEGSRLVWPFIGQELPVLTTPATLYYEWTSSGLVPLDLDDVEVNDATNIHGTVAEGGVFTASRVIISPKTR